MGEAAGSLLPEVEILYPEIPWIDIRGIRNIVVHEYFRVNLEIIWETIKTDLPSLVQQLQEVMEQISDS
ncbi:HepT-like ribonuclease domain-containing protein [Gloeocapsa sp. PCC 7428]|uniref:HepT-like ribonuclease domain-containing protein n=1 Tax=Gloeocapsa sp. PCC 7428 TaxID=1173026 RepID=UPI002100A731|nr:HepT-like ribonuclease domain-containing protein [Gloeocapsa sp. PCC 7428]